MSQRKEMLRMMELEFYRTYLADTYREYISKYTSSQIMVSIINVDEKIRAKEVVSMLNKDKSKLIEMLAIRFETMLQDYDCLEELEDYFGLY